MRRSGPPRATVTATRPGTRALIEVLLLHRRLRRDAVLAGIRAALDAGSVSADVVAIEARKHTATDATDAADTAPASATDDADGAAAVAGRGGDPAARGARPRCLPMPARRRRCATTTSC